mmetsp:Transcript_19863/g.50091  ORF Transcript_19863/g.50091 Transcript_19863/m.50091 type:complete len:241 (+) Transcript_19863:3177-3899(+)
MRRHLIFNGFRTQHITRSSIFVLFEKSRILWFCLINVGRKSARNPSLIASSRSFEMESAFSIAPAINLSSSASSSPPRPSSEERRGPAPGLSGAATATAAPASAATSPLKDLRRAGDEILRARSRTAAFSSSSPLDRNSSSLSLSLMPTGGVPLPESASKNSSSQSDWSERADLLAICEDGFGIILFSTTATASGRSCFTRMGLFSATASSSTLEDGSAFAFGVACPSAAPSFCTGFMIS